jgi:PEGA domain-containing protein
VRAYAEMVHVDPSVALARLERAIGTPAAPETAREMQPAEPPARVSGKALAAIGVTAAVVLVWFAAWDRSTSAPGSDVRARSGIQTQKPERPASPAQIPVNLVAGTSGQTPVDQAPTPLQVAQAPTRSTVDQALTLSAVDRVVAPKRVDRAAPLSPDSEDDSRLQSESDGELIVTTEPTGGRVTVDGVGWGSTPVTIRNLPPGAKRIRVTKDGYGVEERVVHLAPNRSRVTLEIPLRSAP